MSRKMPNASKELPLGSNLSDCLIFDPKGDRVVNIDKMTDPGAGTVRIITAQTCLVGPIPLQSVMCARRSESVIQQT